LRLQRFARAGDGFNQRSGGGRRIMAQVTERPKKKSSQSIDLVEILEREIYPRLTAEQIYNWTGHDFQRSGNRLRGKPPWGQSKSGNSFTAFDDLGFLDAHNGRETGDPIKYRYSLKVGRYEYPKGRDWLEIVKELASEAGVTLPSREWTPQQIEKARRRESRQAILRAVQEYCASILWTARGENERKHLMEERGFTEQGLRDLGIGLYPSVKEVREVLRNKGLDLDLAKQVGVLARKWEGYMIFPWSNPYSEPLTLYGHQSKEWAAATGKPKKYALFNPKDNGKAWLHTKESPYLFNQAIRSRHKEVVLVEGITDAAIAHQLGDTRVIGCVAAMLSKDQCETMARHRIEKVTIALDPDAAGDAGIDSCIKSLLKVGISPYVAPKLPDGLDPDEFILKHGIDAWYAHLNQAVHGYRWKAERLLESEDLATDAGKEAILKQAIAYIRSQSRDDKLALSLYFTPAIALGLGMNIEDFREALERQFGGGDNNGGDGDGNYWGDDDDSPGNHWSAPVTLNGEIGWLTEEEDEDGEPVQKFSPKCNFDFVVERELESEDGGGLVLAVKRSLDRYQKRVIISSQEYGCIRDFEAALKRTYGTGIVCNLNGEQLKSLIHVRLRSYRQRGGKVYKLIDRYGQQEDGIWVFRDQQFNPDGTPTDEEESGWVFNPKLGKDDFIPCPELAPEDPEALNRWVNACRRFFGEQNISQVLLTAGWVVAGLHSQAVFKHDNCFPLLNPNGEPGSCKTLGGEAALSLVGKNWGHLGMLARVSTSALYEHGSRTGSLPFLLDDPERSPEIDELLKTWYNWKPRRVRGNDQQPKSPLGAITNHVAGAEQAATFTRFVRLTYERAVKSGNKQAFQDLRKAQELASGAFPLLLKIGYDPDAIASIERELLPHLPLAHARIAQSLALPLYYAQKIVELTGGSDNLKQWVIDNCCRSENDADNSADSLQDFIEKILALEAESKTGTWNLKRNIKRDGKVYTAIYASNVWSLVNGRFKPATYNFKSLKPLVLKAGGKIDRSERFDRSQDQVLAYDRARVANGEHPSNPDTITRKAWLIPDDLFRESVTGVTECNRNPVTGCNDEKSTVSALSDVPCNRVTEKKEIEIEKETGIDFNYTSTTTNQTPPNPSYNGYTVTEVAETTTEQGLETVTEKNENSVTAPENSVTDAIAPDPTPNAPKPQKLDSPICQRINAEMKRLGWTKKKGRVHLIETYGKRSRQLLTDEELLDFLHHLESIRSDRS